MSTDTPFLPYPEDVERGSVVVAAGEDSGLNWAVYKNAVGAGNKKQYWWGCGYVELPEGHPWLDLDLTDHDSSVVDVHGGITYTAGRWIGWDYNHFCDRWPGSDMSTFDDSVHGVCSFEQVVEHCHDVIRQAQEVTALQRSFEGA